MNENPYSQNTKLDFRWKADVILKWFWFCSRTSRMKLSSTAICTSAWTARARSWSAGWTPRRTPPSSPGGSRRWTRGGDTSRPRAWPSGESEAPSNIVTCHVFVFSGIVPLESLRIWHYNRTKLFVTFNYFPRLKLYISLGGTKYTRFEDILTFYNTTCPGLAWRTLVRTGAPCWSASGSSATGWPSRRPTSWGSAPSAGTRTSSGSSRWAGGYHNLWQALSHHISHHSLTPSLATKSVFNND